MRTDPQPPPPAVVAVVVTCDPGLWFEEALRSLAAQDYPNLSVLVLDVGRNGQVLERASATLASAHVRRLPDGRGFASAANEALALVKGASYLLLCHDDVALASDALRLMVEEAFRSNAGVVTPKYLLWDDPSRLEAVGATTDPVGVLRDLVEPGELDQGQHDAPREVLVAPQGATLVRVDLFEALGGYSFSCWSRPGARSRGEELDLSWRARLEGARVVAAPAARVRHLRASTRGLRRADLGRPPRQSLRRALVARQEQEAGRLAALWVCYRWWELAWAIPVALCWLLGEALAEALGGHPVRAGWLLGSLPRSLRRPKTLWRTRRRTQQARRRSGANLRYLQASGNARLRAYLRARLEGLSAPDPSRPPSELGADLSREDGVTLQDTAVAAVHPEPSLVPPGESREAAGARPRVGQKDWRRLEIAVVALVGLLVLVGSRDLIGRALPEVGLLPVLRGGSGPIWKAWGDSWQVGGLGVGAPSSPALFVLALATSALGGSGGLVSHLVVLGPLAMGPLGAYRGAAAWGGRRAQVAAAVAYAVVPIGYNSLASGQWGGVVAFGVAPFVLSGVGRLAGLVPYRPLSRRQALARAGALSLVVALAASVAPVWIPLVAVVGLALLLGSVLSGRATEGLTLAAASFVVAFFSFVDLLPWSATVMTSSGALLGPGPGPLGVRSVAEVLAFHVGPFGGGPLGLALPLAAFFVLLVGRQWRLAWACRYWGVVVVCVGLAWASGRGWLPAAPEEVLLAPAGAAMAGLVGLGAASFRIDLPGYQFGWRQPASFLAALSLFASGLPLLSWSLDGHWGAPGSGSAQEASFLPRETGGAQYRVLWAGEPASLSLAGRQLEPGLVFGTSTDGPPGLPELWVSGPSGADSQLADDLLLAQKGLTTRLGHLLAPAGVRFVIVAQPTGSATRRPPALGALVGGLAAQTDLVPLDVAGSIKVFENMAWSPVRALLSARAAQVASLPLGESRVLLQQTELSGDRGVLPGGAESGSGLVPAGSTVAVGSSFSPRWRLRVAGSDVAPTKAFGWAMAFRVPQVSSRSGEVPPDLAARLSYDPPSWLAALEAFAIALWVGWLGWLAAEVRRERADPASLVQANPDWFVPATPSSLAGPGATRRAGRLVSGRRPRGGHD